MLSWLAGKFLGAGNWAFRREIDAISTRIASLDKQQLGLLALCVARIRYDISEQTGANLLKTDEVWARYPNLAGNLENTIKSTTNEGPMGRMNFAAAVWLHTLRGLSPFSDPMTRAATKKIWLALTPGFEDVRSVREYDIATSGASDIPADFADWPEGLE